MKKSEEDARMRAVWRAVMDTPDGKKAIEELLAFTGAFNAVSPDADPSPWQSGRAQGLYDVFQFVLSRIGGTASLDELKALYREHERWPLATQRSQPSNP